MADHSFPNLLVHAVFSTKERRDLVPDELQPRLWAYFLGIGKNHKLPVLAAGGIANHAHLLFVRRNTTGSTPSRRNTARCWTSRA